MPKRLSCHLVKSKDIDDITAGSLPKNRYITILVILALAVCVVLLFLL